MCAGNEGSTCEEMRLRIGVLGHLADGECEQRRIPVFTSHRRNQEAVKKHQFRFSSTHEWEMRPPAYFSDTSGGLGHYVPKNSTHSSRGDWWKWHEWYSGGTPDVRV